MQKLYKTLITTSIITTLVSINVYASSVVTTTSNLRMGPSTDAPIITLVNSGDEIEVLNINGQWSEIITDGLNGYIMTEFITDTQPEVNSIEPIYIEDTPIYIEDTPIFIEDTPVVIAPISVINKQIEVATLTSDSIELPVQDVVIDYSNINYAVVDYEDGMPLLLDEQDITTSTSPVELMPWEEVQLILQTGVDIPVYDILSGQTYNVKSFSNGSHADVEPSTAKDTKIMKSTFGGVWSWDVRPVIVTIDGHQIAGSINGMPHGGGVNNTNDMNGQVCIHFLGSTTHNGNASYTRLHQQVAKQAYELSI